MPLQRCYPFSQHQDRRTENTVATIGQNPGNLRNDIGSTSYGRSFTELRERNDIVDELTRTFLIHSTVVVASLFVRSFENENPRTKTETVERIPLYTECEPFKEFWDDTYDKFSMGSYSFTASEML